MADPELTIQLHGLPVAVIRKDRRGRIRLRHLDSAWELPGLGEEGRIRGNAPLLSCSLPLTTARADAGAFLDGYLPEGAVRNDIAARRGLVASDTFGMLGELGRDIAGAITVVDPEVDEGDRGVPGSVTLDADTLAAAVADLDEYPLGIHDDSELSLAGVQHKLVLVRLDDGGWGRPVHGLPSTHIMKPEPLAHAGLATLEHAALKLAEAVGLTDIEPRLERHAGRDCLVVRRYDRTTGTDGVLRRVHQEDLAQATGTDLRTAPRRKYQSHGGPGYRDAAELLRRHSADPDHELDCLVGRVVLTVLVGDADAHAKNLSLLHPTSETISLAPAYDVVPTTMLEHLRRRCALWVGGVHTSTTDVRRDHLVTEVVGRHGWGIPAGRGRASVDHWIDRITDAAADNDHDPLADHVRKRAGKL